MNRASTVWGTVRAVHGWVREALEPLAVGPTGRDVDTSTKLANAAVRYPPARAPRIAVASASDKVASR